MQPEPFAPAFDPALPFFTPVETEQAVSILFAAGFILWALFTIITAYHWLRYGHRSSVALPALATHVIVSALIAIYAVSGLIS